MAGRHEMMGRVRWREGEAEGGYRLFLYYSDVQPLPEMLCLFSIQNVSYTFQVVQTAMREAQKRIPSVLGGISALYLSLPR